MKIRIVMVILAALSLCAPQAAAAAVQPPVLTAGYQKYPRETLTVKSAIVIDAATGEALFEHRADDPRVAASLTKLMTAVIALEQKPVWSRTVTLAAADEVGGGRLRLNAGARFTWRDAFASTLIGSTNNTAMLLMRASGLTRDRFLREMNVRAATLGMKDTVFHDPSGMDVRNVSTARDLARLARYAFANSNIRRYSTTGKYAFTAYAPASTAKEVKNTNRLLVVDPDIYITGGKTGYLEESMYNLAIRARQSGREVVVVTLGADSREKSFDETKALAHWAFKNYVW